MGAFLALFRRKPPETPIKGIVPRLKNIAFRHFRGILGVLIPVIFIATQADVKNAATTAFHIFVFMACFFLFQPVSIQVTGTIPIFALPMLNVLQTSEVVTKYFNEGIALFIVGGMLHLLLNNSGFDRRLALWILCKGGDSRFTPLMLLIKFSVAAFVLSFLSHRLIVASTLTQYVTPILIDMQKASARYRASEPNFDNVRYIICNGIQISCALGGIGLLHASYCTLAFRAIFFSTGLYPDFLVYWKYSAFAIPLAVAIFLVTLVYHAVMLKYFGGKEISEGRTYTIRTNMLKYKSEIPPKITNHELLTIGFAVLALAAFFTRDLWVTLLTKSENVKDITVLVKDASVASIFVIILHILPRSINFVKILKAKKKSNLPPIKPESAILFWRFVDKNTNYGYFFVIGAGGALWEAAQVSAKIGVADDAPVTTAGAKIAEYLKFISDQDFCIALLIICILTVVLTNVISGVATIAIWLPMVLCLANAAPLPDVEGATGNVQWSEKLYQAALAVGLGSSFGYISPFLYTPAYFCHHTGKVPKLVMLKYSAFPCLISAVLLYVLTCFYADTIFTAKVVPDIPPTTEAPAGGGGGP